MGSHARLRKEAEESRADRLADISRVKKAVHEHEAHDHKGEKKTPLEGLRHGGKTRHEVEGKRAKGGRLDRKQGGSKVNVVVAPQGGAPGPSRPVPVPVPVAGGVPPGARPPIAGMGAGPGGPPGVPAKRGGKVKRAAGGDTYMHGASKGGLGRLEKSREEAREEPKQPR
jgi:hypothetical protein